MLLTRDMIHTASTFKKRMMRSRGTSLKIAKVFGYSIIFFSSEAPIFTMSQSVAMWLPHLAHPLRLSSACKRSGNLDWCRAHLGAKSLDIAGTESKVVQIALPCRSLGPSACGRCLVHASCNSDTAHLFLLIQKQDICGTRSKKKT